MRLLGLTRFKAKEIAGGAATAPSFRSAGTVAGTTGNTITPGLPAGTAEDDILICTILTGGNQSTTGWPTVSGWILINGYTYSVFSTAIYWRRAGSSESATEFDLVTNDGGNQYGGVVTAWKDCVSSGTPYTDYSYGVASDSNPDTRATTPTTDGGILINFFTVEDDSSWSVSPPPGGWSLNDDQTHTAGADLRIFNISYDTDTEDNSTQIDSVSAGTLSSNENYGSFGLVLVPN